MSSSLSGEELLFKLQSGKMLSFREQFFLTSFLSMPAMLAQISSIVMQYIDASMVGRLGGDIVIRKNASLFSLVYVLSLPFIQMNSLAGGMLQCSGNMRVPSILNILMCVLDAIFNAFLIFPLYSWTVFSILIPIPGANLGVAGAALGTALAEVVTSLLMLWFLLCKSQVLKLHKGEGIKFSLIHLKKAMQIAIPVGFEQIVMCGAQIMGTRIVSPLGNVAIAANSFAVTAESLCYMPGYGIEVAATTLIGQSVGARQPKLARRLAWISTGLGMSVMTCTGILMYAAAPVMIGLLSPDPAIRQLGTEVLRIEAFAEPMFAASIVAAGVFRGTGDTLIPSFMNFLSMWAVRLPLAALLASSMGLKGVWIAMCVEGE